MKAAIYKKYGAPSVLSIRNVEKPTPKDNEVLVRVYATTVNRTDCAILRAKPFIMRFFVGIFKPNKPIPGTDFAGVVEAVGPKVVSLLIGDKVFGFDDLGLKSQAFFMTICEDKAIVKMPDNISFEQAAASLEGAHYAYNFINKVNIKSGQKVLVNGATGAIGSTTVQLLKDLGAWVTAVCKEENFELVKSIGADMVIDYQKEDFTKLNEKYDYVFDAVGKSTFSKCKPLLVSGGIYVSSELGPMIQNAFLALITPFFGNKKVIFPFPSNPKKSVEMIKKLSQEGKYQAVIDRKYPLEEIASAYEYVEKGQKIGNVVITMEGHP